MIQGEGRGNEAVPMILLVVMKRLCSSIRITSLMIAAKNGFVENKNQTATAVIFSIMSDGDALEELMTLIKNRKIINAIKEIKMDA